jgi:ornithine cyclodeaminase
LAIFIHMAGRDTSFNPQTRSDTMNFLTQTNAPVHTAFLSPQHVAEIVQTRGLAQVFAGMVETLRADFLRWNEFDKTARVASHSANGVIELMPIADAKTYTFKYVNGHPGNTLRGLSTVMAFGVLADVDTGVPLLVSELTLTTALRTAATSVMAAQALARPDSRVMALIGNGSQSEFQALAFHTQMGIEELRLYDIDEAATAKLMRNLAGTSLRLVKCSSAADAARGADIITTVTADKTLATIITPDMVRPGMHINGVGGDCPGKTELHADVLHMGPVFVEYAPQSRVEGDVQQMPGDFPVTELWQVLNGSATGRTSDAQVTVFDSVGFALEDYSALRFMREQAIALGIGEPLPLIPVLADPKNLFSALGAPASALAAHPPVAPMTQVTQGTQAAEHLA